MPTYHPRNFAENEGGLGAEQQGLWLHHVMGAGCLCYFGFLRAGEITVPSESAYNKGVHLNFLTLQLIVCPTLPH